MEVMALETRSGADDPKSFQVKQLLTPSLCRTYGDMGFRLYGRWLRWFPYFSNNYFLPRIS